MRIEQLVSAWDSHEGSVESSYESIRSIEESIASIKSVQLDCEREIIAEMDRLGRGSLDIDGRTLTCWVGANGGAHVTIQPAQDRGNRVKGVDHDAVQ